ncbi:MAG TPA: adenylate/guanylate cyclase domain-containing protein [Nitrospirae bacterium]|nr:adenylate/guanylate cyclase domain-containing protein [Nitrospirota bacterium]
MQSIRHLFQRLRAGLYGNPTLFVPLILTLVFSALTLRNPPLVDEYVETLLLDYRFKVRNLLSPPPVPSDILMVTIDEESLSTYGRWPWSRRLQAELLDRVFRGGPRAVAVDIFYPEAGPAEEDAALAEVIRRHEGRLVMALGFEVEEGRAFSGEVEDVLYRQAVPRIENLKHLRSVEAYRVLLPPGPLSSRATFGHVYTLPDRDGKLRWEILYIKYGGEYIPSLSLQAARTALGLPIDSTGIIGGAGVELGDLIIPTDEFGRLQINYLGGEGTIAAVSAARVLSGGIRPGLFRDKIVFIGTSAMATYDQKNTPFSANMSGVEKNATVTANILGRDFIVKAPLYIDLLAVLLSGALVLFIGRKKKALHMVAGYMLAVSAVVVSNQALFTWMGTRVNLIYPLLTVLSGGAFTISHGFLVEEKKAREIRRMFSSYVTERVVDELIRNPEMARLGGERKEVTVLFSDIMDFTRFSEGHAPEEVVAMLNEYLGAMTEVVFRWEGTLDKFVGDEIVAFWGAPMEQKDHAELAVRCALDMVERLEGLQREWRAAGKPVLDAGIGINTGEVVVGNIGAEGKKMDYTVIGDHVNLGARIEALTRKYDTHILITEFTLKRLGGLLGHRTRISIRGLERVSVKGKEQPVEIYEVRSLSSDSGAGNVDNVDGEGAPSS